MTDIIPKQVLQHLDTLELFDNDCKQGKTPIFLLTVMIHDFILTSLSKSTVKIISGRCAYVFHMELPSGK